jgi:hypothetical protein
MGTILQFRVSAAQAMGQLCDRRQACDAVTQMRQQFDLHSPQSLTC